MLSKTIRFQFKSFIKKLLFPAPATQGITGVGLAVRARVPRGAAPRARAQRARARALPQCYSVPVLQCYSVTVLQCYSVTVLQCYSVTVLQTQTARACARAVCVCNTVTL